MKQNLNVFKGGKSSIPLNNFLSPNNFFKPLVASSLALFLSANIVSAETSSCSNAISPVFCYGTSGSSGSLTAFNPSNVTWSENNSGGENNLYTLKTSNGTASPVDITLQFNSGTSSPTDSLSDTAYTITMGDDASSSINPILQLKSNSGIDMQSKTLTFDFGGANISSSNSNKTMKLDLSSVSKGTAFRGILVVNGGVNQNHFEANFGGDVVGNIIIKAGDSGASVNTNFTFGGEVIGNIIINNSYQTKGSSGSSSTNTFNFTANNPTLSGGINLADGNTTISNNRTLIITGGITSESGGGGTLTFDNSVSITKAISKPDSGSSAIGATTNINFKGGINTLAGGIQIAGSTNSGQNIYNIIFEDSTVNNTIGNITSIGANSSNQTQQQTNNITFNGSGNNIISGIITAQNGGSYVGRGKNVIVFNTGGSINGKIYANGGDNQITFKGDKISSIVGNIDATASSGNNASYNTITFESSKTNTITGNITATSSSNAEGKMSLPLLMESILLTEMLLQIGITITLTLQTTL